MTEINKSQKMNDFCKRKNIEGNCPFCNFATKLIRDDDNAILIRKRNVVVNPLIQFTPVQVIECAQCGFMMLFNPTTLGLVPEDDKKFITPKTIE